MVGCGRQRRRNLESGCATVCLVMPLTKMGKLREQDEKGNQKFCFGLFKYKMSTNISNKRYQVGSNTCNAQLISKRTERSCRSLKSTVLCLLPSPPSLPGRFFFHSGLFLTLIGQEVFPDLWSGLSDSPLCPHSVISTIIIAFGIPHS